MPDGMSPENRPNIDPQMSVDREPNTNDEAEARRYSRGESLVNELITSAETPEELFVGLRQLEKQLDDGNIPQGLSERYTPPRLLSTMYERADMLSYSISDLEKSGWAKVVDRETGEAKIRDGRYAAVALKTVQEKSDNGSYFGGETKYYLGTPEGRKNLEKAYKRAILELEARDVLGEHISIRTNIEFRDSLESLVAIMHSGRVPKFKPDHLEALFNMPSVSELKSNPDNKLLGDQLEEAVFLNLIMLNSGTKQQIVDLLKRPRSMHLITKMAKEEEARRLAKSDDKETREYTTDDWIKDNIGDYLNWRDEDRILSGDLATWKKEDRGFVTKYSNIAAWGGAPGEFGSDKEKEFIEKTVGGLVGSEEAAWLAATLMRSIGAYASEGYVALPDGESCLLPLGEGRYISGDDTGKFHTYMFNMKEGRRGRTSGLKDMIGKIPDMSINLFDWASVVVGKDHDGKEVRRSIWDAWLGTATQPKKDLLTGKNVLISDIIKVEDKEENGNLEITVLNPETKQEETRTVFGSKLEYFDSKTRKNKIAVLEKVGREEGHRLGDLNFKSLEREFHGTFTIMQWLMGNGERPTGVVTEALQTDFRPEDFSLNELKKKWKYIDIVFNPPVLTKGSPHLYDLGSVVSSKISTFDIDDDNHTSLNIRELKTKTIETVKKRYFYNLMAARIKSYSFATKILPDTTLVYNNGAVGEPFKKVPTANLIEIFVNEVMKNNPNDEGAVIEHYIDDITRLGAVDTQMSQVGKIRNRVDSWLTSDVGRVVGKNTV